jgi:hypothetical protein
VSGLLSSVTGIVRSVHDMTPVRPNSSMAQSSGGLTPVIESVHTEYDMTPARLNSLMPLLQRMHDDPAFLERQRVRPDFHYPSMDSADPSTRFSTPDSSTPLTDAQTDELLQKPLTDKEINLFRREMKKYAPHHRYQEEARQERVQIDRDSSSVYGRGLLVGVPRHRIKKRWERLGLWNPKWGVPDRPYHRPDDVTINWKWMWDQRRNRNVRKHTWPSQDQEVPDERAVRLHLEERGDWNEVLRPQPAENDHSTEVQVDDRELFVTSRPWYVWNLEAAEERVRLRRLRKPLDNNEAEINVTARWKEKGYWKQSWSDRSYGRGQWKREVPGWKWRSESLSPEPVALDDIEYTPSEVEAMEGTPPITPLKGEIQHQPRSPFNRCFSTTYGPVLTLPMPECSPVGDAEDNNKVMAEDADTGSSQQPVREIASSKEPLGPFGSVRPCRPSELPSDDEDFEQRHPPVAKPETRRRSFGSVSPSETFPTPISRARTGKDGSSARTRSSRVSKSNPPTRRSARIAEREGRSRRAAVLSMGRGRRGFATTAVEERSKKHG